MRILLPENQLPFDSCLLGGLREYGRRIVIFVAILLANTLVGFLLYGILRVSIEAIVPSVLFVMPLIIILGSFVGAAIYLQPYVAKRGISLMAASMEVFGGPALPVPPDPAQALARKGLIGALKPAVIGEAVTMLFIIRRGEKIIDLLKRMEATTGLRRDDDVMKEYHETLSRVYKYLRDVGVIREIGIGATN